MTIIQNQNYGPAQTFSDERIFIPTCASSQEDLSKQKNSGIDVFEEGENSFRSGHWFSKKAGESETSLIRKRIHQEASLVVKNLKRDESLLIDVLQQADEHKVYLDFECKNLYLYTVKVLGLSESVALNFISVARKAKQVPELKEVISRGLLTVSKARKINSVLTNDNQELWLKKAIELPQWRLEKEVAKVSPQEAVREKMKYITESRLCFQVGISEALSEKLKRVQDLESQRLKRSASFETVLEALTEIYLEKNDPLRKAKRAEEKQRFYDHGPKSGPVRRGEQEKR